MMLPSTQLATPRAIADSSTGLAIEPAAADLLMIQS
jgi:hypothetical protein